MTQTNPPECRIDARQLLERAENWAASADSTLRWRARLLPVDMAAGKNPLLLAAACEVFDLIAQSPSGADLLRNLGFEPVAQEMDGRARQGDCMLALEAQVLRCKADEMALRLKHHEAAAPGSWQACRYAIEEAKSSLASLHAKQAEALLDALK